MGNDKSENQWTIVFFSGTGGTRRAARELKKQMDLQNLNPSIFELGAGEIPDSVIPSTLEGMHIILLFPIYAFDAPSILYEWMEKTSFTDCDFIVISVSGGGEIWPNTGCRSPLKGQIENKGGTVVHEAMLIMPCNFYIPGSDHMNMRLLNILPQKVETLIKDLMEKRYNHSKSRLGFFQRIVSAAEKTGAHYTGSKLKTDEKCTGCGICAMNCPKENIEIVSSRAVFKKSCILCMRCIYNCPEKAIVSDSSFVLKEGFNLEALEERMKGIEVQPLEQCAKGLLWKEVRKYLSAPEFD
jgi:ferredoxin